VRNPEINCFMLHKLVLFCRVNTKSLSELLYSTLRSLGISRSYKFKLADYHVTEYRPWLATRTSQCCVNAFSQRLQLEYVFTIPPKFMSNVRLSTSCLYILFDCNLESLFPFQFVSSYGSSLQLAFFSLSARHRIDSRDDITSAEVPMFFSQKQTVKLRR